MLFIVISNIPIVSLIFRVTIGGEALQGMNWSIHYSSNNPKGFSVWGLDSYELVLKSFNDYKKVHKEDSVLYRNFKMNPLLFWKWYDYLTYEGYKLPYKPMPKDAREVLRGWPPGTDSTELR